MLFQGQEFNTTTPFHYFADHEPEVGRMVREGRVEMMRLFRRLSQSDADSLVPNPCDPDTFTQCKLDFRERVNNPEPCPSTRISSSYVKKIRSLRRKTASVCTARFLPRSVVAKVFCRRRR